MMSDDLEQQLARKGRGAALLIAGTAVFWVLASFLGSQMGLSVRLRGLFDLIAAAGFIWALWMIFQIWRSGQNNQR